MKQAKSIFLSGGLIDANNANHSDYYNKGTICPFCLEKVFWTRPHEKLINGTLYPISATFKHHKGDPLDCEARAKSAEGKKILEEMSIIFSTESKEQRKPIWDKYLWELFKTGLLDFYSGVYETTRLPFDPLLLPLSRPIPDKRIDYFAKALAGMWHVVASSTYSTETNQLIDWHETVAHQKENILSSMAASSFTIKTPAPIHYQCTIEVMESLFNRKDNHLLTRMALVSLDNMIDETWESFLVTLRKLSEIQMKTPDFMLSEDDATFFEKCFALFLGIIFLIDWHELSKRPWKQIVQRKSKATISLRGQGFGR